MSIEELLNCSIIKEKIQEIWKNSKEEEKEILVTTMSSLQLDRTDKQWLPEPHYLNIKK
jgi:hypothetical protein